MNGPNRNAYNGSSNAPPRPGKFVPREMKEGDWACPEATCGNINFSKRTKCNRCGVPRPKATLPEEPVPSGPPGLFKKGDWTCTHCGNVNWARRDRCNICNAVKPNDKVEPRMGRGGGHFDLQDPNDRKDHQSDDEEYDEFGRKKKKKTANETSAAGHSFDSDEQPRNVGTRVSSGVQSKNTWGGSEIKLAFPPAPPRRRRRSSSSSSGSSSDSSSSCSNSHVDSRTTGRISGQGGPRKDTRRDYTSRRRSRSRNRSNSRDRGRRNYAGKSR